jgi:hypothetical protein
MTEQEPPIGVPAAGTRTDPAPPPDTGAAVDVGGLFSVPYRALPPADAMVPLTMKAPSRAIPVLGPALWLFGVLLWAFVAMGALVTLSSPTGRGPLLEEGLGVMFVVAAMLTALIAAVRRSLEFAPTRSSAATVARASVVVLLALPAWLILTMIAAAIGRASSTNLDKPITLSLLGVAGVAAFAGRWLLRGSSGARTQQQRVIAGALWTVIVLVTVLAVVGTFAGN